MTQVRITRTTRVQATCESITEIEQWLIAARNKGHGGAAKLVEPVTLTIEMVE